MILEATLQEEILDYLLGSTAISTTLPSTWTLGLYLGNPLTTGTELTGVNYAAVTVAATGWHPAELRKTNVNMIRWPAVLNAGTGGWTFPAGTDLYVGLRNGTGPVLAILVNNSVNISGTVLPSGDYVECPAASLTFDWYVYPDTQSFAMAKGLRSAILDRLFGAVTWTPPGSWQLALWRGSPFAGGSEVTDPEYVRLTRANDATEWGAGATPKTNLTQIRWPATGTPLRNWGTATHLCLCEAGAAPSIAVALSTPAPLRPGVALVLAPGAVSISWAY